VMAMNLDYTGVVMNSDYTAASVNSDYTGVMDLAHSVH